MGHHHPHLFNLSLERRHRTSVLLGGADYLNHLINSIAGDGETCLVILQIFFQGVKFVVDIFKISIQTGVQISRNGLIQLF